MANKYSKLSIDKTKIPEWINLWCEEHLSGNYDITQTEGKNRIMYTINNNGNMIKIDFLKCSAGLLTIYPNVGSNISISTEIAESIYARVGNILKDSPFANGFSLRIPEEDFNTVLELLSETDGVNLTNTSIQNADGKAKYKLYRFSGPAGDTVTLKYFTNTNRMQLQGKPLFLFNEIVAMVSENGATPNDVVDAQIKYCNIDIKHEDIYDELNTLLGTDLYNFLTATQKAILSTTFVLNKIDVPLDDYSILIQPANRAYEGFAKSIFQLEGLECDDRKQLGIFFHWIDDKTPVMKEKYSRTLNQEIKTGLTSIFKFYSIHRHPYMHASANDYNTPIMRTREKADEEINEIITSMKSWYKWYSNINNINIHNEEAI